MSRRASTHRMEEKTVVVVLVGNRIFSQECYCVVIFYSLFELKEREGE